jgi:hypothetical protein
VVNGLALIHTLSEGFQRGFALQDVTFVNPFIRDNDRFRKAPAGTLRASSNFRGGYFGFLI